VAIVKRALAVRDPREAEEWFRLGPVTGEEAVSFLRDLQRTEGSYTEILWDGSVDKNGLSLDGLMVVYGEAKPEQYRLAFLTPNDKGEWKVDFCAFSRWMRPSWSEILEQNVEQAEIRVLVRQDRFSYYNGAFGDDRVWVAYGIASTDLKEESLVGYCKRGSPQHRAMQKILAETEIGKTQRATLQVRRIPSTERKQLEIVRVLADDWVLAAQPFDEQT
jgi:hypothetical protein